MFKIGVQHAGISKDIDEAYRIIKESGFDGVDVSLDHIAPSDVLKKGIIPDIVKSGASEKDIIEFFRPQIDAAKKYGLDNYQAHSIFPSLWQHGENPEYNAWAIETHKKMIHACAEVGARYLVIHPFYRAWDNRIAPEEEEQINIESYAKLIPAAKEYGITLCLENMFHSDKNATNERTIRYAGCCGHWEEAVHYVDTLNEIAGQEVFGFCLDTGHTIMGGEDIYIMMRKLGKRIKAFHTHDNGGMNDDHGAPYSGVLDWDRFIRGLAEIRFSETVSFETFGIFLQKDREAMLLLLKYTADCGRLFDRRATELVKNAENK